MYHLVLYAPFAVFIVPTPTNHHHWRHETLYALATVLLLAAMLQPVLYHATVAISRIHIATRLGVSRLSWYLLKTLSLRLELGAVINGMNGRRCYREDLLTWQRIKLWRVRSSELLTT